jgi:Protein of unknown function (DUF2442)
LSRFLEGIRVRFGRGGRSASAWQNGPRILCACVAKGYIFLDLTGGRSIKSPLTLYPTLQNASDQERAQFEILGRGIGLHWPKLDYDLSLKGILNDVPEYAWNR